MKTIARCGLVEVEFSNLCASIMQKISLNISAVASGEFWEHHWNFPEDQAEFDCVPILLTHEFTLTTRFGSAKTPAAIFVNNLLFWKRKEPEKNKWWSGWSETKGGGEDRKREEKTQSSLALALWDLALGKAYYKLRWCQAVPLIHLVSC